MILGMPVAGRRSRAPLGAICALLASAVAFSPAAAAGNASTIVDLKQLNVEDLMNVEVTSVSRHPEKLREAASAIQVITQEDIRRSGATSIPEALRLADNLQVAQKNSHDWAISARGLNTNLGNKLLVMIDGRSVYTPLYSGVFWDVQDYLMEDIDRIEVISGPGGTLWGANAVNGVINIITKSAKDTQGVVHGCRRRIPAARFCRRPLWRCPRRRYPVPCLREVFRPGRRSAAERRRRIGLPGIKAAAVFASTREPNPRTG